MRNAIHLFLGLVGLLYLLLAIWCAVDPVTTSKSVGFQLDGPTGQSEFLTVYGGLEFGMALVFLLPFVDQQVTRFSLAACTLIHGSLVAFRSASFMIFAAPAAMTYQLAVGEWVIFLVGLTLWLISRSKAQKSA